MKNGLQLLTLLLSLYTFSQKSFVVSNAYENGSNSSSTMVQFVAVDAGINSELSEIGSNFFMNKFIVVSNKQRRNYDQTFNTSTNINNNNVYCLDVNKEGKLRLPLLFSRVLDTPNDEGNLTYSAKTNTLFYTQTTDDSNGRFKLFATNYDESTVCKWVNIKEVAVAEHNQYSIETPMYNNDGSKLYFSSNAKGGFGGYDLYVADVVNGELFNIRNLGSAVNSDKDEKYPTMDVNSSYMYFASNKDNGKGGFDIYRASVAKTGKHMNVVNLGDAVNTPADEVSLVFQNSATGYISRNKVYDRNDFDVLKFTYLLKTIDANLKVVEKDSKLALPNTQVTIVDEFGNTVVSTKTNDLGMINFKFDPLATYTITAFKDGYAEQIETINPEASRIIANPIISLSQLPAVVLEDRIEIENIYFDFNKATLKEESKLSLNKIAKVLSDKSNVKISIFAHTDTKGNAKYNQVLSEKRAKSAVEYLIQKGIDSSRLTFKGMGESSPKVQCGKCTKDEDAQNRRTEFIIN